GNFQVFLPKNKTANMLEVWNGTGTKLLEMNGDFKDIIPVQMGSVPTGVYLLRAHYDDGTLENKQFVVD
ncbi:MAG: hypothetical protein AAF985_16145, partial [Bacteroidota bacterium]